MSELEWVCDGCGGSLADGGDWDVSAYHGWLCRPCSSQCGTIGGKVPIAGPMSGRSTDAAATLDGYLWPLRDIRR